MGAPPPPEVCRAPIWCGELLPPGRSLWHAGVGGAQAAGEGGVSVRREVQPVGWDPREGRMPGRVGGGGLGQVGVVLGAE